MSNLISDDMLEEVSGGAGRPGEELPQHVCGNGNRGNLIPDGFTQGGKGRYKCQACGKSGRINFLTGTRQLCDLI